MPAESTRSAGEIRSLELVFTAYTLSIIARCWPEVQLVVPWKVRLLDRVDLLLYRPTICPIQRGSFRALGDKFRLLVMPQRVLSRRLRSGVPPITPNIVFCRLVIVVSIITNTPRNCDINRVLQQHCKTQLMERDMLSLCSTVTLVC